MRDLVSLMTAALSEAAIYALRERSGTGWFVPHDADAGANQYVARGKWLVDGVGFHPISGEPGDGCLSVYYPDAGPHFDLLANEQFQRVLKRCAEFDPVFETSLISARTRKAASAKRPSKDRRYELIRKNYDDLKNAPESVLRRFQIARLHIESKNRVLVIRALRKFWKTAHPGGPPPPSEPTYRRALAEIFRR